MRPKKCSQNRRVELELVVLVTGGAGFIGSHLACVLLDQGFEVRVFDKVRPPNDRVDWFKGDLLSKENVFDATKDVEAVFHLAAIADVNVAVADPDLCLAVNELGTLNLLRASSGREVNRFLLASTVWVYGKSEGVVTEQTPIPPPLDTYTKTKIGQEHLVHSWCSSHSLSYTILRYDIPYGPGMRGNMAIASFVRRAMRKEPISIYGEGSQGRCWVFIEDLVHANCLAMGEKARNEIINLAGNEFMTISQIVDLLERAFGSIPVKHEPPRSGDFKGVLTNIEKARTLLGWSPKTSFSEGLSRYIASVQHT